jgi:hypothetical protein
MRTGVPGTRTHQHRAATATSVHGRIALRRRLQNQCRTPTAPTCERSAGTTAGEVSRPQRPLSSLCRAACVLVKLREHLWTIYVPAPVENARLDAMWRGNKSFPRHTSAYEPGGRS